MKTFRTEITISEDKTLTIKELPFPTGDKVEVIVRSSKRRKKRGERYPLRGKPIWFNSQYSVETLLNIISLHQKSSRFG